MADADAPDRAADGSLATADDPDAVVEEGADDEPGDESPGRARRRRGIDVRTLAICLLVALIAALVAGVIANAVIDDGDGGEAASDEVGEGTLSTAEEAPDVPLERFDGTPVSLADYRGQPLVVNFWGSWCQPCVKEMPDFQRVHESLGDDVAFLGVNVNDDPEDALRMAEQTGVTYDLAVDAEGELIRELGVVIFPTTVLILPDGTIVDSAQGPISAERLCEKINLSLMAGQLEECG
jgi:cytochrome c biogenesis protein CcmG, thiol:disulfide interchange protein DsbE